MGRIEEINSEIEQLRHQIDVMTGTRTEVYSRIVGYYRALNNWNRGKSEEYTHRLTFGVPENAPTRNVDDTFLAETSELPKATPATPARYELFVRATCPQCPAMKTEIANLDMRGAEFDVDTMTGMNRAIELSIYATPTTVFFNENDDEVARATSPLDVRASFAVPV